MSGKRYHSAIQSFNFPQFNFGVMFNLMIISDYYSVRTSLISHWCSLTRINARLGRELFGFLHCAHVNKPHRYWPLCQSLLHLFEESLVKLVNRIVIAEDQGLNGVREGLVFPHKTIKGLQSTKEQFRWICYRLFKVLRLKLWKVVTNLCDDLQVFDERPLCGQ